MPFTAVQQRDRGLVCFPERARAGLSELQLIFPMKEGTTSVADLRYCGEFDG